LLRGLPDYFIDKANRQGIFNGRIVVVKSTAAGDVSDFEKQDGLYTLCIRGIEGDQKIEENVINASISRVLNASGEWPQILQCAHDPNMSIVISNTTEVGIQFLKEDIRNAPPKSFPGKLLAFLYERFKAFNGSEQSGMVIIPTELIPDNGNKLEAILLELSYLNGLEDNFIDWLEQSNYFCNSLVDRIVPGRPTADVQSLIENDLGYSDNLSTMCEVYRLWAIEGNEQVRAKLSFAEADPNVIITPDINLYRELKLRLLNGTHTLSCGLAFLAGYNTVKDAMEDETIATFISELMKNEIARAIPYNVDLVAANDFSDKVLDRFRNPHIEHQWINIAVQYSSKMKLRCLPVLLKHYENNQATPEFIALGFAAYLFFMKSVTNSNHKYYGELNGSPYLIQDEYAEVLYKRWTHLSSAELVRETLRDIAFWGRDLSTLPGFTEAITEKLELVLSQGMQAAIEITRSNKIAAA
jgi:tagaturonate reductase